MKENIETSCAPAAIGPYSQAIKANGFLFVSGQLPVDPETGIISEGITEQTKRSLMNIQAILNADFHSMRNVVKTTVFLNDMRHFSAMNEVYASFFEAPFPARAAVQVTRLPKDVLVEIEAIAACD